MAVLTSQKIKDFYERYRSINVTFSKEFIAITGLDTKQVHVKCLSDFFPCIIYASSFEQTKIITNGKSGIIEQLQKANNLLSVRFCFRHFVTGEQVSFFVQGRALGHAPYGNSSDMILLNVQYSQRPPDDLIEIIGRILDANQNASKRKEDRIILTPEAIRKLRFVTKDSAAVIDRVPRRCILRDVSFSGAKIVLVGISKFLIDKEVALRLEFDDPVEIFTIKGKFVHAEMVENRKDLIVLGVFFSEPPPMGYKLRLSDYFNTVKPAFTEAIPPAQAASMLSEPAKP
jgi:hypothetical protein